MDERIQKYEEKMKKTLASLEAELTTIRAGRANPHILDKLTVDYYGSPTPLQQVANITVPEARMIQIQPWESSLIKGIEKAILTSDLGLNPSNDGKIIRLIFPELTEERRKELVKDIKKKGEAAKVYLKCLTLPVSVTRRTVLQKVRGRTYKVLPQLVDTGFQVLFHSPPGVLFTFPSQYYALSVTK